jgi:hypothetical protein
MYTLLQRFQNGTPLTVRQIIVGGPQPKSKKIDASVRRKIISYCWSLLITNQTKNKGMPKYFFYRRIRKFAKNTVYIVDKCEFLYHFLFQMKFKINHVIFTADLVQLVAKKKRELSE